MKARWGKQLGEEPFRLFFPLAVLATVGGVALWPLFHYQILPYYPGVAHARIMTMALAGFVIGFLGTAFPRLTSAPALRAGELVAILSVWAACLTAHFLNRTAAGDAAGAAVLLATVAVLAVRWIFAARDTPPPGGPVALLGLLAGGAASAALAWRDGLWMSPGGYTAAKLTLYQAPALLPLLGVGPYLLPRLFGHASSHRLADSRRPPPGWWPRFLVSLAAGSVILLSFAIEAAGSARGGMLLRAGAVVAVFVTGIPVFRRARLLTTPGTVVRMAVLSIVLGLAWAAFDPARRVGILHVLFVSGIGLVMLGVGVRVVLGHAGRHDLLERRMLWLRVLIGLAVLAAATRVSADFLPQVRFSHLDYAAATWALLALLWLWKLGRYFFAREDEEEEEESGPQA